MTLSPRNTQIEIAAETPHLFSPLVRPTLELLRSIHPGDRHPARMAQIRDEFLYCATPADLKKACAMPDGR